MAPQHDVDYEPLLPAEEDKEPAQPAPYPSRPSLVAYLQSPRSFFLLCCALGLVISTLNLSFISAHDALNAYAFTRTPKRKPSVYLGLEHIRYRTPRCRNRTTYPSDYSRFEGDNVRQRQRVHAPKDEIMFDFGKEQSAHLSFYIPDHGLENCTLTFRTVLPVPPASSSPASPPVARGVGDAIIRTPPTYMDPKTSLHISSAAVLEIHLLQSQDSLAGKVPLGILPITGLDVGKGGSVTTKPFYCKSRSNVALQVACRGDCYIEFGLEGMTTSSWSTLSVNKTGFSLQQYETLSCIH